MQEHTNKNLLAKGIQRIGFALALALTGPILIHSAFKNQEHELYIPVLILGILIAGFAIFMGFKGIKTIMNALFNKK